MSDENIYLASNQADLLSCLYRAVNRYKTNRMWTPNSSEIAKYAEHLFPDFGEVEKADIAGFITSPEARALVSSHPLPNLKTSLNEAIVKTKNYHVLSNILLTAQMITY